jgi:hypothetical protein
MRREFQMSQKLCPVCNRKNDLTAGFCIFCGASLESSLEISVTTTRRMEKSSGDSSQVYEDTFIETLDVPKAGIALYMIDYNKPIAIREEPEFILGRKLTDIKSEKFVDLTPFGGYEYGVSHRHAKIMRIQYGYEIVDLDSTNGTLVNKKRLMPNKPYPFPSGAQIRLGKLTLFAIYENLIPKE